MPQRRRSNVGLVLSGVVVIAAGFAIAIVEALKLPKGSIWVVVGATIVLVTAIRWFTRPR
jgi:hypothetical protein